MIPLKRGLAALAFGCRENNTFTFGYTIDDHIQKRSYHNSKYKNDEACNSFYHLTPPKRRVRCSKFSMISFNSLLEKSGQSVGVKYNSL